jgi:hypothetical protein
MLLDLVATWAAFSHLCIAGVLAAVLLRGLRARRVRRRRPHYTRRFIATCITAAGIASGAMLLTSVRLPAPALPPGLPIPQIDH